MMQLEIRSGGSLMASQHSRRHHVLAAGLVTLLALGPAPAWAAPKKAHPASDKASITVSSLTRGAKVYLNDQEVGEVPLPGPLDVRPGQTYTIRVQKRGFAPFVDTVMAGAGQESEVEADLVPTGGIVKITCNIQRAEVLLNGKLLGRTPFDGDVSPGAQTLQIVSTGYLMEKRAVDVKAGEELKIDVELKPVPPPTVEEDRSIFGRWWFWTGVGAAVIGGVTVGVLSGQTTKVEPNAPNRTLTIP